MPTAQEKTNAMFMLTNLFMLTMFMLINFHAHGSNTLFSSHLAQCSLHAVSTVGAVSFDVTLDRNATVSFSPLNTSSDTQSLSATALVPISSAQMLSVFSFMYSLPLG